MNNVLNNLIYYRRLFHKYPEIGFNTVETKKRIIDVIANTCNNIDNNIIINKFIESNSLIITLHKKNNQSNKYIGFRADIDGININEKSNKPYKSSNQYMHACGHDAHTSILLNVIIYLLENDNLILDNYVFIFQTAEEGPFNGGAFLIKDLNIIKKIDELYILHVNNDYKTKQIILKSGVIMASSCVFKINIIGKSSHVVKKENGIDALNISVKLIDLINNFKIDNSLIHIGMINSGTCENVVSECSSITGTFRYYDQNNLIIFKNSLNNILTKFKCEFKIDYNISYSNGYPCVINDESLTKSFFNLNHNYEIIYLDKPYFLSDDASYYPNKKVYFFIGSNNENYDFSFLHSNDFDIDENCMLVGFNTFINIIKGRTS